MAVVLNPEKCRQRNRLAARRGFDAAPVRLYADRAPAIESSLALALPTDDRLKNARLVSSKGRLPRTPDEALAKINALRSDDREPLTAEQIYVTYAEAANTNYIEKYQFFLGLSTLRNIAAEAEAGFAFMNSHRTGGVSEPTELPYGRTFAGRVETYALDDGTEWSRAILGIYMIRGINLNGANGPSTDDLFAAIQGGTLGDVSMGLTPGENTCDVCGEMLDAVNDDDELICPHVPGTTYAMGDDEIDRQEARGVPGGIATYTVEEAHAREVSAVYAGAVPGAGFRKALKMSARLDATNLARARGAYLMLCRDDDLVPFPGPRRVPIELSAGSAGNPELVARVAAQQRQLESLIATLNAERADRRAELDAAQDRVLDVEAGAYVASLVREGRVDATQATGLRALYVQAAHDDRATGRTAGTESRLSMLKATYGAGAIALTTAPADADTDAAIYEMVAGWESRRNGKRPIA